MNLPDAIPFYGINRFYKNYRNEFLEITDHVFSHGQVIGGPEVRFFEEELARFCGRNYAVTTGSCTDSLYFTLKALGLKAGDEVIVPSFSFIASVSCVLRAGAVPVFADVDDAGIIDFQKAEKLVTGKTRALVYVPLFGNLKDPESAEKFCREKNIFLIEDAAQSLGSSFQGRQSGSIGNVSCISFDPTKVIGAFASGGAVVTDDSRIADQVRSLRAHGVDEKTKFSVSEGTNSRMSTLSAALLSFQLRMVDSLMLSRCEIAGKYKDALKDTEVTPLTCVYPSYNGHKYVIRSANRDKIQEMLRQNGVSTMVHYPVPLFDHPVFLPFRPANCADWNVYKLCSEVLSLPIFPEMNPIETDRICRLLNTI